MVLILAIPKSLTELSLIDFIIDNSSLDNNDIVFIFILL